jgi:uncharacterized protein
VRYLLDVNALIALGFSGHALHARAASWVRRLKARAGAELLTCPITELGFIRVLSQAPQYGFTVAQARTLLMSMKKSEAIAFGCIADDRDVSHLPKWVKAAKQTTDGHLVELAVAHDAVLATLDERIPGALPIPL